jgi:capsid assembly protease
MMSNEHAWDLLRAESSVWLMSPDRLSALAARIAAHPQAAVSRRQASPTAPSNTALVPVFGALTKRPSFFSDLLGTSTYSGIRSALAQAMADPAVDRILLLVDSGGGVASGCLECSSDIVGAARRKNVVAWIDGGCCSAAYWLASGANQIIATPSSEIGSIGVWQLHIDVSRALEQAGVVPTFIVSEQSPRKIDANPYQPMSPEAKARLQFGVNKIADQFIGAVARGRGVTPTTVSKRFGQGASFFSDEARAAGMIDGIGGLNTALTSTPASRRAARLAELRAPVSAYERQIEDRRERLEELKRD